MNRVRDKKLLLERIRAGAEEITSFEELGGEVLPLIDSLTTSATSQMYRSEPGSPMVFVGGTELVDVARTYMNGFFNEDPMQTVARRANAWIMRMSRYPEYKRFVRSPVHDYFRKAGVPNLCHVRLIDAPHLAPGSVGFVLARSTRQPDFDEHDERLLADVLPPLRAAARRCRRTLEAARTRRTLEVLLDGDDPRPRLAIDLEGRLLWASARAERRLPASGVPEPLVRIARELAAASRQRVPAGPPRRTVELVARDGTRLCADARLAAAGTDEPFVVVELVLGGISDSVRAVGELYELTGAETQVLGHLAAGLRDREIAERTHTSLHTVRTHVSRILSKLGVRSRVEATVLARSREHAGAGST